MKAKILFLFGMLCASPLLGQDDLLAMLNQEDAKKSPIPKPPLRELGLSMAKRWKQLLKNI